MHDILFVPRQFPTIQAAVDAVAGPATIMVEPGFYDESVVISDKPYVVVQSVRLSRRGVTFAGGTGQSVLVVERSAVHLSGIEVRSNGRMRGIDVIGSTLTLQECIVAGNRIGIETSSRGVGAGMACVDSSVRIQKSTIAGNTIDCRSEATSEALGGGLYFERCKVEFAGSTIQANAAYAQRISRGGGIWCANSSMRMWRSRVTDNALRAVLCEGAGLYLIDAGACQIGGSVISGNGSVDGRGGGIFIEGDPAPVSIHRNTVVRQNHPDDVWRAFP
ncbi:MAG TPA: right-handed parallel beta-helix repeat-containing protein [Thermoanaerobaculia bacterium]|nr:right-handed parallel beta-helix repeat-containing protein [Thermoanaerobaculia bacterium]